MADDPITAPEDEEPVLAIDVVVNKNEVSDDDIREAHEAELAKIEANNKQREDEIEEERKRVDETNAAARQPGSYEAHLKAAGIKHIRQPNELDEDYGPYDEHNVTSDEMTIHNDGSLDGKFGQLQKGHREPQPLDEVLAIEADPDALERKQ